MRSSTATPPPSSSPPSSSPDRGDLVTRGRRTHASERGSGPLQALRALSLRQHEPLSSHPSPPTSICHGHDVSGLAALPSISVPHREPSTIPTNQRSPSRGRPIIATVRQNGQESYITPLRPENSRRSRRQAGGQRLYLTSSRDVVLSLPGQRAFTQSSRPLPSQESRGGRSSSQSTQARSRAPSPTPSVHDSNVPEPPAGAPPFDLLSDIIVSIADAVDNSEAHRAQEHAKKERQVRRWTNEVLPSLLQPFLHLLRTTQSLRSVERAFTPMCQCSREGVRTLTVVCVFFDRACLMSGIVRVL